ncbi:MAG TPA: HAMP domain-containing histidine kinase, partial [Anaerolineae bacterium]|nr:HAMP domain-containing histidine kinase [Anaerolineae bacterium]
LSDKTIVDLILVAEEAIAEMILLAERQDNHLTLVCGDVGLNVYANRDKLKQVLLNLLDNSLTYCLAGDAITVTVAEENDTILCTVADTGNGIPQQHLARITEQFYRADRQHPGSGLGLAIVKEIVKQHDGHLTITSSTEGAYKGTCVTISLPKIPVSSENLPEKL